MQKLQNSADATRTAQMPTLTLRKIRDDGNFIGFDTIEIVQFNFDAQGGALALVDGELELYSGDDLEHILFGDPGDGTRYYEVVRPAA